LSYPAALSLLSLKAVRAVWTREALSSNSAMEMVGSSEILEAPLTWTMSSHLQSMIYGTSVTGVTNAIYAQPKCMNDSCLVWPQGCVYQDQSLIQTRI
jgi:hypothetical protein